ncbi:hypothetical protein E1301_Tti021112 [Triplophysa tibetana]|uniref:Uncharacterized protein n=1 Tax=Triplophysa tibetana TaxID=1572043 RepID=A0A5A9NDC2_9TELE|nr:hypothetical protein E1301_Tti021112 [Triplophysa tibetana]
MTHVLPFKHELFNIIFSSSNTFRIFDETLPERLDPTDVYQNHKYPVRDPQENEMLKSHNIPHPVNATFIRTNVRFLNEPVAHMETRHTMAEQFNWWSGLTNQDVPSKAPYSKATTQRCDFQPVKDVPLIRLRESNRPPALGIIPTISFIDQPDSPLHSGRHMTDPTTVHAAVTGREAVRIGHSQRSAYRLVQPLAHCALRTPNAVKFNTHSLIGKDEVPSCTSSLVDLALSRHLSRCEPCVMSLLHLLSSFSHRWLNPSTHCSSALERWSSSG